MSCEINILVNGNRCKQYFYNEKIFVEARKGSEYVIEIKNNTYKRVLAVCSVDGLDVLNGKPAEEDNNGYVINGYNSLKVEGFRVSDEEVAKFVFDYKNNSYAASKEDGSEKNVGVIGVRIFEEKEKPLPTIKEVHHHHYDEYKYPKWPWRNPRRTPDYPYDITWTCDSSFGSGNIYSSSCMGDIGNSNCSGLMGKSDNTIRAMNCCNLSSTSGEPELRGFDLGTKYGEAKESKVVEVEFERGILVLSTDIYYASRESLIEMGVPMGTEKQVSFPQSFKGNKYSTPPKGWKR